ncbi:helix-turn-helix domain-containing protein [Thiohalomonas denitrificans]|uniref:helix-turn-helix domain-containing protein n=1 Tax=Thiohalomonas denitrificans TaxID=415747 RepID=UPI00295000A6|nr:helix-turn-helix transcriptional regulator [Thiohalomonas denitrificans]
MGETLETAFGQVLRARRIECKLSQERLALEAGVDRTFISFLERGLRQPSLRSLFALAEALDTSPAKLVAAVEARKPSVCREKSR